MNDLEILKSQMEICELHKTRIELSLKHVMPIMPITVLRLGSISDEELGFLELMTSRFAKLQDSIGKKLFPSILKLLQEYDSNESFLDQLHKLEKLGVIESVEFWSRFRKVRNDISHEYPNHPELIALSLNHCVEMCKILLGFFEHLKKYVQEHIFSHYKV